MDALLAREDVQKALGISRATFFRLLHDDPSFPRPVDVTGTRRVLRWRPEDVAAWVEAKSSPPPS